MSQKGRNIWIGFSHGIMSFIFSLTKSLLSLARGKEISSPRESYDSINYIVDAGPKEWAKKPSGIGLGRMLILSLLYFFRKHAYFSREK